MEKPAGIERLALPLMALWCLVVVASYLLAHPTMLAFPVALALPFTRVLFLLLLSLALSYAAAPLMEKLDFSLDGAGLLISCAVGWSFFLWALHLYLYGGGRSPLPPLILILLLAIWGVHKAHFVFKFSRWKEEFSWSTWTSLAILFLAALAFVIVIRSQTPPVGPDSLIYHIKEPAKIYTGGDYGKTFGYPFWGYIHDFYVIAVGHSDILAKSTPMVFTVLTSLCLFLLARLFIVKEDQGGTNKADFAWALLPIIVYLSSPAILFIAGTAYLEPVLAFYLLATTLTALQEDFLTSLKKQMLFAFLLVNAVAIKQTALLFAASMGALWFIILIRKNVRQAIIVSLTAIVLFSFHPRSATTCWQMGTPLGAFKTLHTRLNLAGDSYRRPPFPGYVKLFGIEHMRYKPEVMQKLPPPMDLAALLWFVSTGKEYPAEFLGNRPTPLLLIFVGLLLLSWKSFDKRIRGLVLVLTLSFVAWYLGGTYWLRFFTPLLTLFALLLALALWFIKESRLQKAMLSLTMVIVCALFGAELLLFLYVGPQKIVLALEEKDSFLHRRLPHISPMAFHLKKLHELGELGKYLVLGNAQDYYYPGEYIAEGNNLEVVLSLSSAFQDDERAFIAFLQDKGVKHVLVDGFGLHFWLLEGKRFGAFSKLRKAGAKAQSMIDRAIAANLLEQVHEEKYLSYSSRLYRLKN